MRHTTSTAGSSSSRELAGARGCYGFTAAEANAAINSLRVACFGDAHSEHRRIGDHNYGANVVHSRRSAMSLPAGFSGQNAG